MAESFELFPGYRAEKLDDATSPRIAYRVIGPRKTFRLMRNQPNPTMLFVLCDDKAGLRTTKIRGFAWFTDRDGTLRPAC